MKEPKEGNKFCGLTPSYTLDVPGHRQFARGISCEVELQLQLLKKSLPRHGRIYMTCKLENQPPRGVLCTKNCFFISRNLLKRVTSTRCKCHFFSLKFLQEVVNTVLKEHLRKAGCFCSFSSHKY